MFTGLKTRLERIIDKFTQLPLMPKRLFKLGFILFIVIFAAGTFFALGNRFIFSYNPDYEYIGSQLVKNSFTVLAEFVVGAVVMDFVFGRNK